MTEAKETRALVAALIAARKLCSPTVHKAGANQAQGYKYVGHEHVLISGSRAALLENGLALILLSYELVGVDVYKTRSGDQQCWRWRGHFRLLHVSGDELGLSYEATTGTNDKAGFVASTALDRTAHLRVLELAGSDEENPEHDSHEPPKERGKPAAARAERKQAAAKGADPERTAGWWRDQHNLLCDRAFKAAGIESADADVFGLHPPKLPMPKFSDKAQQHAGLAYDKVPPGYLRSVIWKADDFAKQPAPVRLWVSYLVAKHEIAKLEAEAADRALGAQAAGGAP